MKKCFLAAPIILFLSSCSAYLEQRCLQSGGAPHVNQGGYAFCGVKYSDGGNECRDSSECQGDCYLPYGYKKEPPFIGYCAHDDIGINTPPYRIVGGKLEQAGLGIEE